MYEKQLSDEVMVAVVSAVSRWEVHGAERPLPALVSSLPAVWPLSTVPYIAPAFLSCCW